MKLKTPFLVIINIFFGLLLFLIFGNLYALNKINRLKENKSNNYYWRPHQKYSINSSFGKNKSRYKSNINSIEKTSYGDICYGANYRNDGECIFSDGIRVNRFITDKFGFKTLGDLDSAKIVLIGDSFLSAMGGDAMEEQLGPKLYSRTRINIYEAGYPGNPDHYIDRLDFLKKSSLKEKKFIILLFEGNDFSLKEKTLITKPWHYFRSQYVPIIKSLKDMPLSKIIDNYSQPKIENNSYSKYILKDISGRKQAFKSYLYEQSKSDLTLVSWEKFLKRKNDICSIVLIPTASSVYLLEQSFESRHPSLQKQFNFFEKEGFQIINLTSNFKSFTRDNPDIPLWWADDTHWNKNGINLASKIIADKSRCFK